MKPAALLCLCLCLSVACAPLPRSAPVGAAIAAGFRSADDSLMAATLERDGLRVSRGPITLYAPPAALTPPELAALADTLAHGYRALRELLAPARPWHRYDSPRIRIYLGTRPAGALTDAGSRIFFPLAWTDESRTTLLHEMAHVFLMPRRPLAFEAADTADVNALLQDRAFWFDEGMAEYAAQRVARQIGLSTTLSLGATDDIAGRLADVTPRTLDQWLDAWHGKLIHEREVGQ